MRTSSGHDDGLDGEFFDVGFGDDGEVEGDCIF